MFSVECKVVLIRYSWSVQPETPAGQGMSSYYVFSVECKVVLIRYSWSEQPETPAGQGMSSQLWAQC